MWLGIPVIFIYSNSSVGRGGGGMREAVRHTNYLVSNCEHDGESCLLMFF